MTAKGFGMNEMTSTSTVQLARAGEPNRSTRGCGKGSLFFAGRKKWLLFGAMLLAAAGLVLGSSILGFAAILPLLYVLPCLLMAAMCMRGQGGGSTSNGDGS